MQGMRDAWEQLKEMRNREEETNQRAAFLQQGFALPGRRESTPTSS